MQDEPLRPQEMQPDPMIRIMCKRVPVPQQPGMCTLQPFLSFQDMPGDKAEAWRLVHGMLTQCLQIAAEQMVQAAKGEGGKVLVFPTLPDTLVRH